MADLPGGKNSICVQTEFNRTDMEHSPRKPDYVQAGVMAQGVEVLAAKLAKPNFIPKIHVVEGKE